MAKVKSREGNELSGCWYVVSINGKSRVCRMYDDGFLEQTYPFNLNIEKCLDFKKEAAPINKYNSLIK